MVECKRSYKTLDFSTSTASFWSVIFLRTYARDNGAFIENLTELERATCEEANQHFEI